MTHQEKSTAISLGSTILMLGYYLLRLFQMLQNGNLDSAKVFRLWGIVIVAIIIVNVVGMILAYILSAVAQAAQSKQEIVIEDIEDERDELIKLKGTRVAHIVFSIGVLISMLTLVIGKPPLLMFSLLIFFCLFSNIIADISRIYFSRRGV